MSQRRAPVLVTGAAGFIGHATARRLLDRGEAVVGVDIINSYYSTALKRVRLSTLLSRPGFTFHQIDVADESAIAQLFRDTGTQRVVHLAAQAGVRYSIEQPFAYQHSNLRGHLSILEACRAAHDFVHLVYASSSSVYGERPLTGRGFCEDDPAIKPVSLYAATKRACELMSASYAHLYGFAQTGLRFFTVYGPWGRPDMAYFSFTRKIFAGEPIEVFGEGRMSRDFTYIDDIVDGIIGALDRPPPGEEQRLLNIGDSQPIGLMTMIEELQQAIGIKAELVMRPMQAGDVTATFADIRRLNALTGYRPRVMLPQGLLSFVNWYREHADTLSLSQKLPNLSQ